VSVVVCCCIGVFDTVPFLWEVTMSMFRGTVISCTVVPVKGKGIRYKLGQSLRISGD